MIVLVYYDKHLSLIFGQYLEFLSVKTYQAS